ncbi:MAG: 2-dehydropantoate 2-reductase [Steroidobacter sp.]
MKVCIYGAGAIGGFIGARLAAAGECTVSAVARGDALRVLREYGWRLRQGGALIQAPVIATDEPGELGPQDVVIIAVKGPALPTVASCIAPLLVPQTVVVPAMNGVPWWFNAGIPELEATPLESVDPNGRIADRIPLRHVVGCVVHASASSSEPGVVEHKIGQGLIIGEPLGEESERVRRLARLLSGAGFELTTSTNIRRDIWYKLWGNMTMNPISAITGATCDRVLDDPLVREFCAAAMREAGQIGARIGCAISQTTEDRFAITRKLGRFKTSMLQDVEAGRMIELDALLAVVREIGVRVGVATPNIDALFGLTRLFGRGRGVYPD